MAISGFQLFIATHAKAAFQSLKAVWDCPESDGAGGKADTIIEDYESGLQVRLSANDLNDPAETWIALAKAYVGTSLDKVHGRLAWVAEPNDRRNGLGGVLFVENGVKILVQGDGEIPLKELLAVADSLEPYGGRAT